MNWDGDVVAERMIVQEVDGEEENNVEDPATDRDLVRCKKEPTILIELSDESCHSDKKKLHKCQKGSYNMLVS